MPVWSDRPCAGTGQPIGYGLSRHLTTCPACRYAARQYEAAKRGWADGQCGHCGQWRSDGRPPIEHPYWCDNPGREDVRLYQVTKRKVVEVTESETKEEQGQHTHRDPSPWVTLLGEDFHDPE